MSWSAVVVVVVTAGEFEIAAAGGGSSEVGIVEALGGEVWKEEFLRMPSARIQQSFQSLQPNFADYLVAVVYHRSSALWLRMLRSLKNCVFARCGFKGGLSKSIGLGEFSQIIRRKLWKRRLVSRKRILNGCCPNARGGSRMFG